MPISRSVVIGFLMLGVMAPSVGQANQNIPVVDASPSVSRQTVAPQTNVSKTKMQKGVSAGAQGVQLFYQLELLQQEVQTLRGIVEQQEYQMKRMREEQRDRYLDLDRRITLLNQANLKPASSTTEKPVVKPQTVVPFTVVPAIPSKAKPKPATGPVSLAPVADEAAEKTAYQAAFALVRNKQYEQATDAFRQQIKNHPDGNYTGNAYYWLGEVLLVESDYQQALAAFDSLLDRYPGHRKTADAKYKQGKIYLQLGDTVRAKQLLQSVVKQHAGTSAAKLAEAEIRDAEF